MGKRGKSCSNPMHNDWSRTDKTSAIKLKVPKYRYLVSLKKIAQSQGHVSHHIRAVCAECLDSLQKQEEIKCPEKSASQILPSSPTNIAGEEKESQSSHVSERTVTLSSPSQKLWQSSQDSPDIEFSVKPDKESVYCEEIEETITVDGEDVILRKDTFDKLVSKSSTLCDHRPSVDAQTQVAHMATLLIKVFDRRAIPRVEDSVNDPVPANISLLKSLLFSKMKELSKTYVNAMPDWLHAKFFDPESQRHRLLVHDYQQQEIRELRSMTGCKLVDCIELPLRSYADFSTAMRIILDNGLSGYLQDFVAPFLGDWPAQYYVRQMVYNEENNIQNIISFLGPLHISINARENVVLKFYGVFRDLYSFLFHGKKALAMKPKPWRISFLLEVMYGGWTIVRDEILGVFAHCKDVEFVTFVNLLDNYIPLVLSIYSIIFKNKMTDLYYGSILRCWLMFLMFRRRHYDKALLISLSNVEYLKSVNHPLMQTLSHSLCAFDEYPVENFHSLLRARTRYTDTVGYLCPGSSPDPLR